MPPEYLMLLYDNKHDKLYTIYVFIKVTTVTDYECNINSLTNFRWIPRQRHVRVKKNLIVVSCFLKI